MPIQHLGFTIHESEHTDGKPHQFRKLTDDRWTNYKRGAIAALDRINKTAHGRRLIAAIPQGRVTIALPGAKQGRMGADLGTNLKPRRENTCVLLADTQYYPKISSPDDLAAVLRSCTTRVLSGSLRVRGTAEDVRRIVEAFAEIKWRDKGQPWTHRWSSSQIEWVEGGELLARYVFEKFLTPGHGAAAVVQWDPDGTMEGFATRDHEGAVAVSERASFIGLAHEFVHAWRGATGRGIFEMGREDEHMTVGLMLPLVEGKASSGRQSYLPGRSVLTNPLVVALRRGIDSQVLTENAIRRVSGAPLRPIY